MKDLKAAFILALCIGLVVLVSTAHCSINPKKSNTTCFLPEGCVTQYVENPYTYKAGKIDVVGTPEDAFVLRIQPLATYSLFTEDILFCHLEGSKSLFSGKHNPLLLTYKTKASHLVQGVGCHDLVRVDELKEGKE